MSPRQTRVLLASFAVVMAGVTVNALVLQAQPRSAASARVLAGASRAPDRNVATIAAHRPVERTGTVRGQLKPDAAEAVVMAEPATAAESPELVRAIQRELSIRGYGGFSADAGLDLRTRAAIMAFEHDQHAPLTGEATDALMQHLVLGAPGDAVKHKRAGGRSPKADGVVRHVQHGLSRLGYQAGRPDGRLTDETLRSIREFELDNGLIPSGRISAELVAALDKRTGGAARTN